MNESRRDFLKKSALVYTLAESGARLKAGANDQIGLGFIGTGIRGMEHFRAFQSIPGAREVAVADLYDGHLARARELAKNELFTTKDYQAVLARKDVDAVVIATPDHWHHKMTLDALAAGKHVYVEKPLAWSIEECRDVVAAAAKSDKLVQVGSQDKTSALTAKAREIVKSGALGKVNQVKMENHRNTPEGAWVYAIPPDASEQTIDWPRFLGSAPKRAYDPRIFFRWRCWWEYSGGVATDLFVHLLTDLHELMDVQGPSSVVSQGGIYRWDDGRNVPDLMSSIYEYPQGFVAQMYVNLGNSHSAGETLIMGSDGTLVMGRKKLTLYPEPVFSETQKYSTACWPEAMRKQYFDSMSKAPTSSKPAQEIEVTANPSHQEYFILSLRNNTPSKETALEGYHAAGAAHLANIAYRKGRRAHWDIATGKVTLG
jgi:predicted dehydrogenase